MSNLRGAAASLPTGPGLTDAAVAASGAASRSRSTGAGAALAAIVDAAAALAARAAGFLRLDSSGGGAEALRTGFVFDAGLVSVTGAGAVAAVPRPVAVHP